jgi:hypothetical protein
MRFNCWSSGTILVAEGFNATAIVPHDDDTPIVQLMVVVVVPASSDVPRT